MSCFFFFNFTAYILCVVCHLQCKYGIRHMYGPMKTQCYPIFNPVSIRTVNIDHGSSRWALGCLDILEKTKHVVMEVHNNDGNNSHLSYCNVKDRKAYQIITHWSNMKWRSNQSYHQTILKIDFYVCPNRARVPNGLSISPHCHSSPHNIWCMLYIFGIAIYFSRSMNPIDCKVCMLIIIWLLVCTTKI